MERLDKMLLLIERKQRSNPEQVFFDNLEFLHLMNVSKRTAQSWRDSGMIAFSQIGGKIYYQLSDILVMLAKFHKPSKS
jgi:hypothetical protein